MVGIVFHRAHGSNIELLQNRQVARRHRSFANAIAFSHRPLTPGETFLFEIEEQELGWAGHVRCGVTIHNPRKLQSLPQYLLPDFAQLNDDKCCSWVYALKPSEEMPFGDEFIGSAAPCNTCCEGFVTNSKLNVNLLKGSENILPTDVGSRIGIHITVNGELFFFVNGTKFGPFTTDLPIQYNDVFAVVDLYGITKQIKVIQVQGSSLCQTEKYVVCIEALPLARKFPRAQRPLKRVEFEKICYFIWGGDASVAFSNRANLTGKNIFRAQKTNFPVWKISYMHRKQTFESGVYVSFNHLHISKFAKCFQ